MNTNTAGDGPTSHEKYLILVATNTVGNSSEFSVKIISSFTLIDAKAQTRTVVIRLIGSLPVKILSCNINLNLTRQCSPLDRLCNGITAKHIFGVSEVQFLVTHGKRMPTLEWFILSVNQFINRPLLRTKKRIGFPNQWFGVTFPYLNFLHTY